METVSTQHGVTLRHACATHVGLVRSVNEDAVLCNFPVFVVADGMGGHSAGELAAEAAMQAMGELAALARTRPLSIEDVEHGINRARELVNAVAEGRENGAGCTLTGVVLVEHEGLSRWLIINVGDSRVYLQQGGGLLQLTRDHSLSNELAALGHEQADSVPRNMITRALGAPDSRHDAWLLPVRGGTRLLVCSDGLHGMVNDATILQVLMEHEYGGDAADELVAAALLAGGRDNVTVAVIDVVEGLPEHSEPHPDDGLDATLDTTVDVLGG